MVELTGNPAVILTLPGVFGKWSKPYYNSVVATFCYNITRNIPIEIYNADSPIKLVYIDDVIDLIIKSISERVNGLVRSSVENEYCLTVGDLAKIINQMHLDRGKLFVGDIGVGFQRALYSTYISFLPKHNFKYCLPEYTDNRGSFVEMLKTRKNGQFSFLIAKPGITRGNHYHHTKTEKFLVVKGVAHFKFKSIISNEIIEFITRGDKPEVVDTIPGYSHSIENIGDDELVVVIWASELYDQNNPDTINIRF
jgi:UDP-2-acetamido-2,6-beta-L-arabino-hexul-4-ose reductase